MKLPPTGLAFSLFLGALAALPPLSIDMALPALGTIRSALNTSPAMAGLTLSLFMAGFAASPIVYGPLADRFGRRRPLLVGLVLFTLGSLGATAATSIAMLLAARLVQGVGAGAGMAIAFAIVRDLFEGHAARTRLAVITVVANVAPIVAPAMGAGLLACVGWRGIYGVTALSGVLLAAVVISGLAETLPVRPSAGGPMLRGLVRDYRRVLTHGETVRHVVVNGLGFGWMFAYVAGSPLVLIGVLHVSTATYAGLFACTGAGIVAGASINGQLARLGASSGLVLLAAILLAVLATGVLVGLTVTGHLALPVLVPLLVLATGCFGLAAPSASHGALDPIPELAGIASGLLASVQMFCGAAASALVAFLFPHLGTLAMTGTMAAFALAAMLLCLPMARTRSSHAGGTEGDAAAAVVGVRSPPSPISANGAQ